MLFDDELVKGTVHKPNEATKKETSKTKIKTKII
jgi:hypothetical protein